MEKKSLIKLNDSQIKILDIIAILDILHMDLKKAEEFEGVRTYKGTFLKNYATTPNHKWRVLSQIAKEQLIEIYLNDSQLMN